MNNLQNRLKEKKEFQYDYWQMTASSRVVDEVIEIPRTDEIEKYSKLRLHFTSVNNDSVEFDTKQLNFQPRSLTRAFSESMKNQIVGSRSLFIQWHAIDKQTIRQWPGQFHDRLLSETPSAQQRMQKAIREAVDPAIPTDSQLPKFKFVLTKPNLADTAVFKCPIDDKERVVRKASQEFSQKMQLTRDSIKKSLAASVSLSLTVDQKTALWITQLRMGLDLPSDTAINAVLEIQMIPIPENKLDETVQLLVSFIEKNRGSNSRKVLVAVGAAIRKVLQIIGDEQLGLASQLMKSTGSLEVPVEVELEVAKMVVHRFRYAPSTSTTGLSDLADLLLDNARIYSKTNLVNRKYYGATALNSVLSIILMRHKEASALIHYIESHSPSWFVDLVKSRLRRMAKEIENEKLVDSVALVDLMKVFGTKTVQLSSTNGDE